MTEPQAHESDGDDRKPPFAPVAVDGNGDTLVCCEMCGGPNIQFDGWDIDKCRDCGHWRYR